MKSQGSCRGTHQMAGKGPESLYDFSIVSVIPLAVVRVKFAPRNLATLAEIAKDSPMKFSGCTWSCTMQQYPASSGSARSTGRGGSSV
ncbi:MAG: hypothetical protein M0Q92_02095 [Methanoregula sp.]|nr:hypothetical protein [Methanoregula sp.]